MFVNLTYRGDDEYGRAAYDFNTKEVTEMNEGAIRDSMEKVKGEDREENMRTTVDYAALMQKDGFKKGISEANTATIERMLRSGEFSENQIAYVSNSSVEKVREVAAKLGL